jgi:deoxyhypusine synthase
LNDGGHEDWEIPMTDTLTKTAAANPPINDTRKAELLSKQVKHIDITKFDARPIVDAMADMSFTSRDLGRATNIYNQMLADKDCTIFLVIAGSTSAGGCMDLYAELVRNNMVDGIVATGATIVDMDFFEGLGHKHYQALEIPDDDTLRSLYIDRIYDTYIDEEDLQNVDHTIFEIAEIARAKRLFVARFHPRDGQVSRRARQEGQQPRQARLRA